MNLLDGVDVLGGGDLGDELVANARQREQKAERAKIHAIIPNTVNFFKRNWPYFLGGAVLYLLLPRGGHALTWPKFDETLAEKKRKHRQKSKISDSAVRILKARQLDIKAQRIETIKRPYRAF